MKEKKQDVYLQQNYSAVMKDSFYAPTRMGIIFFKTQKITSVDKDMGN